MVKDVDGNRYVDTIAALGPILLGHHDRVVTNAVLGQMNQGVSFSLPHPLEVEVAELLVDLVPRAEQVRFGKNGGDATNAAIRLARYVTGKRQVLCAGYFGMHDWYIGSTANAGGVLADTARHTVQTPWGDPAALAALADTHGSDLAAIIVEVPPLPWASDALLIRNFLSFCHMSAHMHNALFILDEVVTGWRYGLGGACQRFRATPDLVCYGKALANGYPLSALAGPRDLMRVFERGQVFWSTTYGGDAVALAAAKATLLQLAHEPCLLACLAQHGQRLGDGLALMLANADVPARLDGNEARMVLRWGEVPGVATEAELHTLWMAEHLRHGILYGVPIFPMTCYDDAVVTKLLDAADAVLGVISEALRTETVQERLGGHVAGAVFAERYARVEG
jgi:glutamate-1-semialdehyde aminotransferase